MKTELRLAAAATAVALLAACGTAETETESDSGTRTVETHLGAVEVPTKIESVVVLDGRRDLDLVLSLGLPLIGVPRPDPENAY